MRASSGGSRWYCQPSEGSFNRHEHQSGFETDELQQHPHHHDQPNRPEFGSYHERWRHADDQAMRFTDRPSGFHADLHGPRLTPVRVAELRASAPSQLRKSASLGNSPVQQQSSNRRQSSREYEAPFEIFERSLRRHESWADDAAARTSERWRVSRAPTDSDDMSHQRYSAASWHATVFRSSSLDDRAAMDNQYVPDSLWGSPSSLRSSLDGASHLADQLNGWNGLRVDSPGGGSPSSDGSANTKAKRVVAPPTVKQSRYLREMDRRIILSRLTKGEKQAALAKEYGVSRSTICNLLKQKDIVLARKDENPLSRHPKRMRLSRSKHASPVKVLLEETATRPASRTSEREELEHKRTEPTAQEESEFLSYDSTRVIEVQSRALLLLKTKLHNRETSDEDFQRCYTRLMRLLIEEAIGIVAARAHKSSLLDPRDPNADQTQLVSRRGPPLVESLCAVAIGGSGTPLLDIFRLLEPEVSTGFIGASLTNPRELELHIVSHPNDLHDRGVLLLDMVMASGDSACASIELLRSTGVREDRITIVALFVAADVVAIVQYAHPSVRILTAGIDVQLHQRVGKARTANDSASSSRVFLERFLAISR